MKGMSSDMGKRIEMPPQEKALNIKLERGNESRDEEMTPEETVEALKKKLRGQIEKGEIRPEVGIGKTATEFVEYIKEKTGKDFTQISPEDLLEIEESSKEDKTPFDAAEALVLMAIALLLEKKETR